jgi:hypothetical protein
MHAASSIAITADAAEVLGSDSTVAVTGHWIDPATWTLDSALVALDLLNESHTKERLFSVMKLASERFNLGDRMDAATTDNGRDFVAAVDLLVDLGLLEEQYRCATHTIQLVFMGAMVR